VNRPRRALVFGGLLPAILLCARGAAAPDSFRFAILGDRTGEAQSGVYEQVWREVAAENPAFVVSVGDTIQGMSDATAEAEWREAGRILELFRRFPLYLAPGNHDIWSPASERLFQQHAAHPRTTVSITDGRISRSSTIAAPRNYRPRNWSSWKRT